MAEFTPDPPPLELPDAPAILSPNIPLNPPMVGEASPWIHVDGENRDLILESIRAWVRHTLLPWTASWQTQLTEWETDAANQLNAWMTLADTYITDHAVAGLSFRSTATAISTAGPTDVTLVVDTELRPIVIGDLVLSVAVPGNYGIVTALIDDTHATVTYTGSLLGPAGYSWRSTTTPIADTGTTNVTVTLDTSHPLTIRDLIVDTTAEANYGIVTAVLTTTTATVSHLGSLQGPQGPQGDPGAPGVVQAIVAGANVTIDSTDPANPIISAAGAGGGVDYTKALVIGTEISLGTATSGISWVDSFPADYATRSPESPGPVVLTNQSVAGATSVDELNTLIAHIDDDTYGYVFIEMSFNDYATPGALPLFTISTSITKMLRMCLDRGITPIIIGMPEWNLSGGTSFVGNHELTRVVRDQVIKLAALLGIGFANLASKIQPNAANQIDGLMPTLLGQQIWSAAISTTASALGWDSLYDDFIRPNAAYISPAYSGHSWEDLGSNGWTINTNVVRSGGGGHADMLIASLASDNQTVVGLVCDHQGGLVLRNTGINGEGYYIDFNHGNVFWSLGGSSSQVGASFTPPATGDLYQFSVAEELDAGTPKAAVRVWINGALVVNAFDTNVPPGNYNAGLCDGNRTVGSGSNLWSGELTFTANTANRWGGVPISVYKLDAQ